MDDENAEEGGVAGEEEDGNDDNDDDDDDDDYQDKNDDHDQDEVKKTHAIFGPHLLRIGNLIFRRLIPLGRVLLGEFFLKVNVIFDKPNSTVLY